MRKYLLDFVLQLACTAVWFLLFVWMGAPKGLAIMAAAIVMQLGMIEVRLGLREASP